MTLRQDTGPPLGYCIFRFDTEETASEDEDDDDLCDVAYWCVVHLKSERSGRQLIRTWITRSYELQIEPGAQRQGVGRILMDALGRLAGAFKMDKTMLTAFKRMLPKPSPSRAVARSSATSLTLDGPQTIPML